MPRSYLDRLKRKEVIVMAGGFRYKGILLEVTETEITLRAPTGFVSIQMDRITSVKDAANEGKPVKSQKFIEPSFYDADQMPAKPDPEKKD